MLILKLLRWACLAGFPIYLALLLPRTLAYQPGSPLTTDEYLDFFASMRPKWKASMVCQIRRSKGCQDPKILQLDQYENHGEIPGGPICADLPHVLRFETFCMFAQFRCSNRRFYVKRILCPELEEEEAENEQELGHIQEHEHEHGHVNEHGHGHEAVDEHGHEHVQEHGHEHGQEHEYEDGGYRHEDEYEDEDEVNAVSPSPIQLRHMRPIEHSTPSRDARLRSNIDAILKYSFAVSGQEPVSKESPLTTASSKPDYVSAVLVAATAEASVTTTETHVPEVEEPTANKELSNQQLHKSIHRLIGMAFSLEQSLNAENPRPFKGKEEDLNMLTSHEGSGSKGSLLALDKDEALVILCYAVLQDICISSAVSKAWKQMEAKTFGFGDLVCDNLGRRHADICSECAFCSLKTEQCQGASNLKRTHCVGGIFTSYINPGILAQHQAMRSRVPTGVEEYFGLDTYAGLKADYWCGRLAAQGCDDYRVSLWLKTEYSSFQKGDFPKDICDSTRVQHPTYCAFKSKQCLKDSHAGEKVMRKPCQKNHTYRVLSREEGEEEVVLWNKKFFILNKEGRV